MEWWNSDVTPIRLGDASQAEREVAIVDPGSSYEAELEVDRLAIADLTSEDQRRVAVQ